MYRVIYMYVTFQNEKRHTEVSSEEQSLGGRGPLLKDEAVVWHPLYSVTVIAACELIKASFGLLKECELLLKQPIPSKIKQRKTQGESDRVSLLYLKLHNSISYENLTCIMSLSISYIANKYHTIKMLWAKYKKQVYPNTQENQLEET